MSYRLEPDESLGAGLKRIIHEQIDRAVLSLENVDDDPHEAIHDARKRFKKIRAVMRLVRDEVGSEIYRRENVCYRDAGRALSDIRDSYVRVATVDALFDYYADYLDDDAFQETRQRLMDAHRALSQRTVEEEDVPSRVIATVQAARPRIAALPIGREDYGAIRDSVHRVYKRGYWGLANSYEEPLPENFHDWRKRVKYLWYHVRILNPLWPNLFDELADQIHDLSDYLGDAHDFAGLCAHIEAEPSLCPDDGERELLLGLADRRRAELEAEAHPLGRRIYAETPEEFVQRMAEYWQAWQAEGVVSTRVTIS